MTDKEYTKQKKRVQQYIDKWHDALGLGWFHIDMTWNRERKRDSPDTAADTTTHWQYRTAWINWYLPSIADNDEDFLEGIVVHEFTHILVAPLCLVDEPNDLPLQHEYATECLARAFRWTREAGERDAKKETKT
jgi:hypothetical protein